MRCSVFDPQGWLYRWSGVFCSGIVAGLLMLALSGAPALAQTNSGNAAAGAATGHTTNPAHALGKSPRAPLLFSPLYILLSDAMDAVKLGDAQQARQVLTRLANDWQGLAQQAQQEGDSLATQNTLSQLGGAIERAQQAPTADTLGQLSAALVQAERTLNPVDHSAAQQQFIEKIRPVLSALEQLAAAPPDKTDAAVWQAAYQRFNGVWLNHERVVRSTSMGHYGRIETAMALLRVGLATAEQTAPGKDALTQDLQHKLRVQVAALSEAINNYAQGKSAAQSADADDAKPMHLRDGIALLKESLVALQTQPQPDVDLAQTRLTRFITLWPTIESAVSTRDSALYQRVESQVPLIMARASPTALLKTQQANTAMLHALIQDLNAINPDASYGASDAMLILLREGLEAMLIVLALLSALTAAQQTSGKPWIYAGVLAGVGASVLAAFALMHLWPLAYAGRQREVLEGAVGLVTVVMMLWIGVWLHSKANIQSWNAYIRTQMQRAMSTGRLFSLFALSFLAVFREGAETIVFYAGIMPRISQSDFGLGIALALAILALLAWLFFKTSIKLSIPRLFQLLTWVIYALGFKILGISIHTLQLTAYLPHSPLTGVSSNSLAWLQSPNLGLYLTTEGLAAQALYVLMIVGVVGWKRLQQRSQQLVVSPANV